MASPTAIPHPEASAHHHHRTASSSSSSNETATMPLSRSPTGTSPRSMVSPIYTQAGRSSFSLPGPNSTSTSPTTTTWYSAGFASGNSQRVRSPTSPFTAASSNGANGNGVGPITSACVPQRDAFPDARHPSHFRTSSFGAASNASSLSSADLRDEPTTPRGDGMVNSMTMGRASSIPMAPSYETMKARRDSWSFATTPSSRWSGLQSLRDRSAAVGGATMPSYMVADGSAIDGNATGATGPMGGLLRKFSISGGQPLKSPPGVPLQRGDSASRGTSTTAVAGVTATAKTAPEDYFSKPTVAVPTPRGRQGSISATSSAQRRRPSPMGERLLMGHFNAH